MSDRTGRKPKGTMVRPAPDWFDDNMGVGGSYFLNVGPAKDNFLALALFNNDQQGRTLKVYGLTIASDGGAGFGFFFAAGAPSGVQQPASALRPDRGVPVGQLFLQSSLGNPIPTANPFLPATVTSAIGSDGFDSNTIFSDFPMFVVPQGYSLIGTNFRGSLSTGIWYWWQVADD